MNIYDFLDHLYLETILDIMSSISITVLLRQEIKEGALKETQVICTGGGCQTQILAQIPWTTQDLGNLETIKYFFHLYDCDSSNISNSQDIQETSDNVFYTSQQVNTHF